MNSATTSHRGSYQNALEKLRVRSHAWKLIGLRPRDQCEWGFKVVIEFTDDPDFVPSSYPGAVPFMPITEFEYKLFDQDGFHLTTLVIDERDPGFGLAQGETRTFQYSARMSIIDAQRANHGTLNVRAGYPRPAPDTN